MTTGPTTPFLHLPLFDGPLDLLLHLCRRQELSVAELPVAEVTAQFLGYLDHLEELEVEVAGEFVEMAALLCLIKSRELLPVIQLPDEDDEEAGEGKDPREELVTRLLEYKRYRESATELEQLPRLHREFFLRGGTGLEAAGLAELPDEFDADLTALLSALRDLLEERRRAEPVHEAPEPTVSLQVRMEQILAQLAARDVLALTEVVAADFSLRRLVVSLLAVLELARLQHLGLHQRRHLERLELRKRFEGATPPELEPLHA